MRTTIEIADDKLRRLREIAAQRGEKGYSKIIDEALEAYFAPDDGRAAALRREREERAERILALAGSISQEEAEAWKAEIRESRKRWRTPSSTPTS